MKYAKVYIDKNALKRVIGINENDIEFIDLAITRVELNPDDSIDITFALDDSVHIEGLETSNSGNSQQIRRQKLE